MVLRQSVRNNQPIPKKIADAPQLLPGLDFFYTGFLELCTCRSVGFGTGPIPWTAVNEYAMRHSLTDEEFDTFSAAIKRLDVVYVQWREDKAKTERPKK